MAAHSRTSGAIAVDFTLGEIMSDMPPDPRIDALAIAFCELAKSVCRDEHLTVTKIAAALDQHAKKLPSQTASALSDIARKLRNP